VVHLLLQKFKPKDMMTQVELHQELNTIKMKKQQEPAVLFEQISAVEKCYNMVAIKVSKENLIAVILDAASAEYQAVLTSEQRAKGDKLQHSDLKDAMSQHWHHLNKSKGAALDEEDNKLRTLSAIVC
jgi:hypothetical protein